VSEKQGNGWNFLESSMIKALGEQQANAEYSSMLLVLVIRTPHTVLPVLVVE
jgi:hypothetical protein